MRKLISLLAITVMLGWSDATIAGHLQKGWAAYHAGDYPSALREWRELAEQGDAKAQFNLGLMYASGQGVAQDDTEAVKWWRLAAEQGLAEAQFDVGLAYHDGLGVDQDYAESVKWWRSAAPRT